ncbi:MULTISPECIES: 4Fe-4S dicluster domain-containing protein [Alphaproteobacteria]|uniref:Ferredoxin n=2 Tax=Alphaproteobacteria TaxID=28211 RepID=A0A512HD57_9HYPH|nr:MULTISPECIES: 4Fe-4S dicluster domain-containing protein [Alphaproteobacteria]GEO83388.1 ferredoxin [Ciceribacter naphthalenivorans]GLR20218.1 ferredoxin [Ciceribacter naphthalenivorans]GLT03074.1 ferredoxin [Sphingomonas psychrolutea]
MSDLSRLLAEIAAQLAPHGLHSRGVARFDRGAGAPVLADGGKAHTVLLIGNVGGSLWRAFSEWRETQPDRGGAHPLDRWSKQRIGALATMTGGTAYYPSDPPYQPFQRWAIMAEGLKASPLGILIHPAYGLWHGYRGALGFAETLPEGALDSPPNAHPCESCRTKACLNACPAGAVTAAHFDVAACRQELLGDAGHSACMHAGCLARAACPVGAQFCYPEGQLRFHMEALGPPS